MQKQQMFDQAYNCNQLMIVERLKNLETAQIMLRCQLENDTKAFNKTLVDLLSIFYHCLVSLLVNRLIKDDVNKM
jgi:hypothetical protein